MRVEATPRPQFWLPRGSQVGPFLRFLAATRDWRSASADPDQPRKVGLCLVRFGSTKCFRVFQPRPLSGEDGFKAGDNLLVRKIKTEGSNRN